MLNIVVVRAHQADEGRKEAASYHTLSKCSSSHILSTHPITQTSHTPLSTHPLNTSSAHPLIHPLTHLPPPTPKPTYPLVPLAGLNHGVVTRMFWALANPLGNIRNFDDENVRVSIVRELVARAYPQIKINFPQRLIAAQNVLLNILGLSGHHKRTQAVVASSSARWLLVIYTLYDTHPIMHLLTHTIPNPLTHSL